MGTAAAMRGDTPPGTNRAAMAGGVAVTVLACAAALALFPADMAVGGGWAERVAVPARMAVLVLLATLLLARAGQGWRDVGLRAPASAWRVLGLVLGGYVAVAAVGAALTLAVLPALGIAPKTAALFAALRGDTAEYLYWLLPVAWGSAAFGEELLFRGFLQSRLEGLFGSGRGAALFAVLAQAAIFGALHAYQGPGGALLAAGTGLVLGSVYLVGGRNLWPCILLHGLVDTVSLTALYLGAVPAGA